LNRFAGGEPDLFFLLLSELAVFLFPATFLEEPSLRILIPVSGFPLLAGGLLVSPLASVQTLNRALKWGEIAGFMAGELVQARTALEGSRNAMEEMKSEVSVPTLKVPQQKPSSQLTHANTTPKQ